RVGVAGSIIAVHHVDEAQLLWRGSLVYPSIDPFHSWFIGAHRRGGTNSTDPSRHAGPAVGTLLDDLHLAGRVHVHDRGVFDDIVRSSTFQTRFDILVVHH